MPPKARASARPSHGRVLVIVESPAKAKTIQGYLGAGYDVEASVGHVRDLPQRASDIPAKYKGEPWARLGVDIERGFAPLYVVDAKKKQRVADLKKRLAESDELLLATDEDREGEAIAWHLRELLSPKVPVRRMVFHEITPEAIRGALEHTRDLDMQLVDAQETRRIIDRLFGYEVSPVLWKKVVTGLSAGRVQSVAVRLVVERERERIAFRSAEYWDIEGVFDPGAFDARLVTVDGSRVATGRDFDDRGALRTRSALVLDEAAARALADELAGSAFSVRSVEEKPGTRRPAAPFMTSTLQQEAARRWRWGAQRTMRIAQGLYDRGFITYMRTDSTTLSEQAISAARAQAAQLYGPDHVSPAPRRYDRKVKNAQEAHEAIRPAGEVFRLPGEVAGEIAGDDFALYDLIWKRTVASQMVDARVATTTVRLAATTAAGRAVEFGASGTVVVFPGFLAAYEEAREDDGSAADDESRERRLPVLREGQQVQVRALEPEPHRTSPPARYTEASLVRALEERGIGRPSTYAAILGTIQDRGYVTKRGSALVPSFLAFAVIRLLEQHFADLVDYSFTARLEEVLDQVAGGDVPREGVLSGFYFGDSGREFPGLHPLVANIGEIDARGLSTFPIEGSDAVLRVGRYGAYVERDGQRANLPADLAPDELTAARAEELLSAPSADRSLGHDPVSGREIVAKAGRYGPYVTEVLPEGAPKSAKPRTGSLFASMALDTVTLDQALRLLSLPRVVGTDPADGVEITAQNGRYGPYLAKAKESRTLPSEEAIFTVSLEEALALLAQPKPRRGRGQATTPPPLRELGTDPVSGKPIVLRDGRFGPYVTDGETNASLRRADDPDTVTLERASDLIAEKRAQGPAEPKRAAPRTAKAAKPRGTRTGTGTRR